MTSLLSIYKRSLSSFQKCSILGDMKYLVEPVLFFLGLKILVATISVGDKNLHLVHELFKTNYNSFYCGRYLAAEKNIEQLKLYLSDQYQLSSGSIESIDVFYQQWLASWEPDHFSCTDYREIEIRKEENPNLPNGYPNFRAIPG